MRIHVGTITHHCLYCASFIQLCPATPQKLLKRIHSYPWILNRKCKSYSSRQMRNWPWYVEQTESKCKYVARKRIELNNLHHHQTSKCWEFAGFYVLGFGGRGAGKRKKVVLKTGVLERQVTYFSLFPKWLKELCSSSTTLFIRTPGKNTESCYFPQCYPDVVQTRCLNVTVCTFSSLLPRQKQNKRNI